MIATTGRPTTPDRRPVVVAGTATVIRFNWPKYAAAVAVVVVALVGAASGGWPAFPLVALAALVTVAALASVVATWWVYDHRHLYEHVAPRLGDVGRWASVHAGFDDATPVLLAATGREPDSVVGLATTARAGLVRARHVEDERSVHADRTSRPPDDLGLGTASVDTVFVTLAVHEVRDLCSQRALFRELARVLRPGGRLVVTEHLRDLPNALVYGPAVLHFQPGSTWFARAEEAGLELERDDTITPFVHRLIWRVEGRR